MHPNRLRHRLSSDVVAVRILDRQVPGVKRFGALLDRNHLGPGAVAVQEPVAGTQVARVDPSLLQHPGRDVFASVLHLTDDSRSRDDVLFSRHETR